LGLDCTKWMFFSTSSAELFADDRRPFKEPIKLFLALVFVTFYKDLLEPASPFTTRRH
jgi:hypothetical protein